jgi:hypothetical protein
LSEDNFKDTFREQIIWGYRFLTYDDKKNKTTLYFRQWIEVGIVKKNNLQFNIAKLDENFIFRKLKCKSDIFRQILLLKRCLASFQYVLESLELDILEDKDVCLCIPNREITHKCNFFYTNLITKKHQRSIMESN